LSLINHHVVIAGYQKPASFVIIDRIITEAGGKTK